MLGATITAVRKEKGMKQYELAEKSGLAGSTICDIEKGRLTPSLKTLEKIAETLEIPIGLFFLPTDYVVGVIKGDATTDVS